MVISVVTYTKNYGNFVSTYTRNIILLEFGLYYRVLRDAEFEFDNFMFTRSSPCQPILKKHGISVSTYTKNIKMPTKIFSPRVNLQKDLDCPNMEKLPKKLKKVAKIMIFHSRISQIWSLICKSCKIVIYLYKTRCF